MCRSLMKYFDNVNESSSRRHCVHIMETLKDEELKKLIEYQFATEKINYLNEIDEQLQKSKKWIDDNKNNLIIRKLVSRDPHRRRFYDTIKMINVELVRMNENGDIVVKDNENNEYKLKYIFGEWKDYVSDTMILKNDSDSSKSTSH